MTALSLEELMQPRTKKPIEVPTDELGNGRKCYVLNPTTDQAEMFERQWAAYRDSERGASESGCGFKKFTAAWCLADDQNKQLLSPGDENDPSDEFVDQMEHLGGDEGLPSSVTHRLFDRASQVFGFSKQDLAALEKNFVTTPTDDGSGSNPNEPDSGAEPGSEPSKTPES